jgi:hypothetical protein
MGNPLTALVKKIRGRRLGLDIVMLFSRGRISCGSGRRKTFCYLGFLVLFTMIRFEIYPNPKRFIVTIIRSTVFPALRPRCLPRGRMPSQNTTFAITSLFLPRDGPDHWTEQDRAMVALSESNKLAFCAQRQQKLRGGGLIGRQKCSYINGTAWATKHYHSTKDRIGLDEIKGGERGVWFKPVYLDALINNAGEATDLADGPIDWVLYMDSDTMIVNFNFCLHTLLAGVEPEDVLIISRDAEGINGGVFLLRNNELGRIITKAWTSNAKAMTMTNDQDYLAQLFNKDTGYLCDRFMPKIGFTTNDSVANISGKVSRPRMKIVRQCAMQSGGGLERSRDGLWPNFEGTYARGDFAVHFFGRPDKLEQMRIVESGSIGFLSR